ncbi:hypothetical protein [Egicoccus sp. AB-alg2]|uniref:hypothetical protein n=1 Tax=Egicoccus sp. AB-alg2 TaxID=3242693 RepID=UPI00359DC881
MLGRLRRLAWLVAAGLLLGVAGGSAPVFVTLSGDRLLQDELASYGEAPKALTVDVAAATPPTVVAQADRLLREELAALGAGAPHQRLLARDVALADGDRSVEVNLVGFEDALEHLPAIVADGPGPVAVTAWSAGRLGLGAGDTLRLRGTSGDVEVPLGPIVEDFDYYAMPAFWRPVSALVSDDQNPQTMVPPPALLMDVDTLGVLVGAAFHGDPAGRPDVTVSPEATDERDTPPLLVGAWDVPVGEQRSLTDAAALVPRFTEVERRAVDRTTPLGQALTAAAGGGFGDAPHVSGQLASAVARTDTSLALLARPVDGLGLAAQVLALAVVAVAAMQAFRHRLSRARLYAVRGVSPLWLALRSTTVATPAVAAGVAAGWALAVAAPEVLRLGEGVAAPLLAVARVQAPTAVVAALLVVAATVGVTARTRARTQAGEVRFPPVVELLLVALAAVAWWARDPGSPPVLSRGDGSAEVDLLVFAFPLLLILATAAVGARLLRSALRAGVGAADRRATAWRWRGGAFLAFRRLRSLPVTTAALLFVTSAGVGILVAGATLAASAQVTVAAKAGVLVGADATMELPRSDASRAEVLASMATVPAAATVVRRVNDGLLDQRRDVDVLVVDPDRFGAVAYQPRSEGAVELDDLLGPLRNPASGRVPVVAVGAGVPDRGLVQVPGVDLDVEVVARTGVFPGITGERPAIVVAADGPLEPEDVATRARLLPNVVHELWLDGGAAIPEQLREELASAFGSETFTFAADFGAAPTIAPVVAVFRFLRGLAVAIAALGLAALLAHHLAQTRDRALSAALLHRMGLPPRSQAAAQTIELGVLVLGAALLGAGAGLSAARLVAGDYDPLPAVPLPVVVATPTELAGPILAAAVGAVIATVGLARRRAARTDVTALLREGT